MRFELYTLGHSNHRLEEFLGLLKQHGITALADVRSLPYSRRHPDYNREALKNSLKAHGIAYVFLGDSLGGRGQEREDFTPDGWVDYERLKGKARFKQGIERLKQGMVRYTIALLCAEKDPLCCHRGLMLAPALAKEGICVYHILADGSLERHCPESEDRLLDQLGYRQGGDLFAPREELLAQAYRARANKVAYRVEK